MRWEYNTGNRNTNGSFVSYDFTNTPTTCSYVVVFCSVCIPSVTSTNTTRTKKSPQRAIFYCINYIKKQVLTNCYLCCTIKLIIQGEVNVDTFCFTLGNNSIIVGRFLRPIFFMKVINGKYSKYKKLQVLFGAQANKL